MGGHQHQPKSMGRSVTGYKANKIRHSTFNSDFYTLIEVNVVAILPKINNSIGFSFMKILVFSSLN